MKNLIVATLVLATAGVVLAADEKKPAARPAAAPAGQAAQQDDPVILSFGTTQVRKSEFEAAIKTLPEEYQALAAGPAKRSFAEDYARMKMLAAEAVKKGLDKDPQVQMQIALMRDNALANAAVTNLQQSLQLTDMELKKAYEEQKGSFERVKARHILIAPEGSPAAPADKKLTDEQAKAKAEEIRTKVVGGADFADLAKKESHDVNSGARGGDLGDFGHGDMVPEFEQAAFGAKAGEIPPVVKTQFGYHVIQVVEKVNKPFEEVKPDLDAKLRQQKLQERLEAMKTAAKITFDDKFFGPEAPVAPAQPEQPAAKPADQPKTH